ncbi:hypothetical protein [Chenggangzhangella methanolivorans]|uniref:Uncharacterized protein n=1 Tax=Chenggangzhangella methanolivorans TaxID=1437009 RepID=A0A9E6UKW3_9HYPH|nr:hypothetical protein [Chenggangzhangella methanolivorans]QZN98335.1 hypothetical protein K6K41_14510 [Chenggangzhangella methanolivorans]
MRFACACLLASASLLLPSAAGAAVVWQGLATVTAATPSCRSDVSERRSIAVGTVFRTVLRPKNLSDNGPDTRVAFVHDGQAHFAIILPGGSASGTYASFGVTHSGLLKANDAAPYAKMAMTPKSPSATTPFVTFAGKVENFMFISGCTISFSAAYGLRP